MEYNIEKILEMYEDDYNPSSTVPGPRNMNQGGRIGFKPGGSAALDMTKTLEEARLNFQKLLSAVLLKSLRLYRTI